MYIPKYALQENLDLLHKFVAEHSFGVLINQVDDEPEANHFPFILDPKASTKGVLWTHMARNNPQWKQLQNNSQCLAIFQGPHAYISPSYYVEKLNVPTWNYTAVHAKCIAEVIEDTKSLGNILDVSVQHFEGQSKNPWKYNLPEDFKGRLINSIIGVKLTVVDWQGKFKLSQNRNKNDYSGVVEALESHEDDNSRELLKYMKLTTTPEKF